MRKKDAPLIKVLQELAAERERGTEEQRRVAAWLRRWSKELEK